MLWRPRPDSMRRTSTVRLALSNAVPTNASAAPRRRSGDCRLCGRVWFMYCVVTMRWKYSTARASQPVTSRASCSSTSAVPLRRRRAMVCATSARALATLGVTPCRLW